MASYLIGSGLPDLPVGLSDKEAGLVTPLYRAINSIAQQLSILTGNAQYSAVDQANLNQTVDLSSEKASKIYVKALEPIPYGKLVTISVDGGKLAASLADATVLTKPAHGICDNPGGIATGSYGVCIFMQGKSAGITGAALGSTYYLSTAGDVQLSSPTADGVLNQIVGTGLGSLGFYLNVEEVGQRVSRVYKTTITNLRVQYTDGTYTDWTV